MEETECAEDWVLSIIRECCGAIEMRRGETVTGCEPEPRDNGHPLSVVDGVRSRKSTKREKDGSS